MRFGFKRFICGFGRRFKKRFLFDSSIACSRVLVRFAGRITTGLWLYLRSLICGDAS
jgi:hypothetical protein